MGYKKFYETPAGKVRAQLILNSGVQYGQASAEFRLGLLHYAAGNEYRRNYDTLMGHLLGNIFFAAGINKVTDESRDNNMKFIKERIKDIADLLALTGKNAKSERDKRAREERRVSSEEAYAVTLAKSGTFNSLEQLQGAILALNEAIGGKTGADAGPAKLSD